MWLECTFHFLSFSNSSYVWFTDHYQMLFKNADLTTSFSGTEVGTDAMPRYTYISLYFIFCSEVHIYQLVFRFLFQGTRTSACLSYFVVCIWYIHVSAAAWREGRFLIRADRDPGRAYCCKWVMCADVFVLCLCCDTICAVAERAVPGKHTTTYTLASTGLAHATVS